MICCGWIEGMVLVYGMCECWGGFVCCIFIGGCLLCVELVLFVFVFFFWCFGC